MRILPRYHLENYFLDEHVWAKAFELLEPVDSWLRSPDQIRTTLRDAARGLVSYASALAVAAHARRSVGNLDIMPRNCHGRTVGELKELIVSKLDEEQNRLSTALDRELILKHAERYFDRFLASVNQDTQE